MSPSDCFCLEAKTTAMVGLAEDLIDLLRGGGYECDVYNDVTLHHMTLYMHSLLI
jgi:hypothetical protein